jgi:hypothetical protein
MPYLFQSILNGFEHIIAFTLRRVNAAMKYLDVKMKYQYSKTAYLTAHVQSYRTLHISLENRYNKKAIDFYAEVAH